MAASFLHTIRSGAPHGAPFLALHDRYQLLEDSEALLAPLGDAVVRIAVQSPRAQSAGGSGITKGYFWYIGPLGRPELSTLGDGLYQLELLIEETYARYGQRKIGLIGSGEGGVIAILAALIFPDRVSSVVAYDAPFPENIDQMPVQLGDLAGMPILLGGEHAEATGARLTERGATVTTLAGHPLPAQLVQFFGQPA